MSERPDLKVVPLPPPTDGTPTLIAMLESALERARDGDLESFVMVAMMRGGGAVSARHSPVETNRYALLGALNYEAHEIRCLIDAENARITHFNPDDES